MVVKEFGNFLGVLFGVVAGAFGLASGTAAGADGEFGGHGALVEHLAVGVDEYKVDIADAALVHVVDSVVAAAANADYLDVLRSLFLHRLCEVVVEYIVG